MKVIFDDLATEEFNDAVDYYELQVEGLGTRFRNEITRALRLLKRFPQIGGTEKGDVRRYLLHKFSYKLLYSIEKDYIYVIAVAHTHREPNYWVNRIKF